MPADSIFSVIFHFHGCQAISDDSFVKPYTNVIVTNAAVTGIRRRYVLLAARFPNCVVIPTF